MHRLLLRQLRRHLPRGVDPPANLIPLLEAVDQAYVQMDEDRALLERSLELSSKELNERFDLLKQQFEELAATREALERTVSLANATLNATVDGILVVDLNGRIVSYNQRLLDLWRIPREIAESRDDDRAIISVLGRVKNPDAFLAKIRVLYADPSATSQDIIELTDGTVLDRYSLPQFLGDKIVGRVWSFTDVTTRYRDAETLRRDRGRLEKAQQIAHVGDWTLALPPLFFFQIQYLPEIRLDSFVRFII